MGNAITFRFFYRSGKKNWVIKIIDFLVRQACLKAVCNPNKRLKIKKILNETIFCYTGKVHKRRLQQQTYNTGRGYQQPQTYNSDREYPQPQTYNSGREYPQPQTYNSGKEYPQPQTYNSGREHQQPIATNPSEHRYKLVRFVTKNISVLTWQSRYLAFFCH